MFKVCKGKKLHYKCKWYYENEILPVEFVADKSWISNGIIYETGGKK